MPKNTLNETDEVIALCLASGCTVEESATKAGVNRRTIYNKKQNPEFRARVREIQQSSVDAAVAKLSDISIDAVKKLADLLNDENSNVKLGAVRTALEYCFRGEERFTLAKKLEDMENAIRSITNGESKSDGENPTESNVEDGTGEENRGNAEEDKGRSDTSNETSGADS